MRKTPRVVFAVLVGLLAASSGPAGASGHTQQYRVSAGGDAVASCAGEEIAAGVTNPENVGGVCFKFSSGRTSGRLTFQDAVSGGEVGWYVQFYNASGEFITGSNVDPVTGEPEVEWRTGCGNALISPGFSFRGVKVWLDGPVFGPLDCPRADMFGIATTGSVTWS